MESSQPKPCENNKDNILDLYENFDFTQTNNDMNKSSNEILNNSINKKPLPRSKNDLIFFEDNNEKQDVDENLEFLKEIKRNNEDKDVMRNEEDKDIKTNEEKNELKETTQNEKIISRLRNSGNFHQTEISRLNESRINDRKNSSFTKY